MKHKDQLICDHCKQHFSAYSSQRARRRRFCNRECYRAALQRPSDAPTKQSRTYKSWANMKSRCLNENDTSYHRYGGAGVTIDQRWIDSFAAFHADMGDRPEGKTLDRQDGTKGYSRDNCRWSSPREQQANLKNNVRVSFQGEELIVSEIARRLDIRPSTLAYRIKRGWPEERWGLRT